MLTPATEIAHHIIWYSHEHGDPVSNLKLQKLMYYVQGWNLALRDEPIFPERIEAWVHGPVVPPIYGEFKRWTWQPIMLDPLPNELPAHVRAHVDQVMEVYGSLTPIHLERMTHSEAPWIEARGGLQPDESSTAIIGHDSMKKFFKQLLLDQAK